MIISIEKGKNFMGLYSKIGGYAGYDRNNKERDALDYYSTPTEEVTNILNILNINFNNTTILEPCCGGGHMVQGILNYIANYSPSMENIELIATDIQDRGNITDCAFLTGKEYDFFADSYPYTNNIDYIIMNPPYSVIEPFTMKALSIANKGVLMLGRLQFLEGEKRFNSIFKDYPPTDVYVYVDRIACYRNGDTTQKQASAQAYAWFYWDFKKAINTKCNTAMHWIRRKNKQ